MFSLRSLSFIWLVLALVPLFQLSRVIVDEIPGPEKCTADQFFNTASLKCISCGTNLVPTADRLSCECRDGYKKTQEVGSSPYTLADGTDVFTCAECPDDEEVTPDGWDCVKCTPEVTGSISSTFNEETLQCDDTCEEKSDRFLAIRTPSGEPAPNATRCDTCAAFFKNDPSTSRCTRCSSDFQFLEVADCQCGGEENEKINIEGRLCLEEGTPEPYTDQNVVFGITYEDDEPAQTSPLLQSDLRPRIYNCSVSQHTCEACGQPLPAKKTP